MTSFLGSLWVLAPGLRAGHEEGFYSRGRITCFVLWIYAGWISERGIGCVIMGCNDTCRCRREVAAEVDLAG